jgi:hypothetical protein
MTLPRSKGDHTDKAMYAAKSKPFDVTTIRDSSLCTANRIEFYQMRGVLLKCAVYNTKWSVELLHGKQVYSGKGNSRKKAVEMAEQQWRENEIKNG